MENVDFDAVPFICPKEHEQVKQLKLPSLSLGLHLYSTLG